MIAALDARAVSDVEIACQLIREARDAGADGIKIIRRTSASPAAEAGRFGAPDGAFRAPLHDPQVSIDAFVQLLDGATDVTILVAPYDVDAARQLMHARFGGWKIDPPMLTHLPLLEELVRDGRPIVAGVAGCTRTELDEAAACLPAKSVLVHTLPAQNGADVLDIAHLVALRRYGHPIGYADGSADISAALIAVALGASLVEKPFILNHVEGPARDTGLTARAFRAFVEQVRRLEDVLTGGGTRDPLPEELDLIEQDRVSIVASRSIPRGTTLSRDMLAFKAPGSGLSPRFLPVIEGQRTLYDIPEGAFLTFGVIEL